MPGLDPASARRIEAFFAKHPKLTERVRALIVVTERGLTPWRLVRPPRGRVDRAGESRQPSDRYAAPLAPERMATKARGELPLVAALLHIESS
ncbi:hypothetical protein [Cupriavidus neocaledonicus]|uniref:Uncharacterized protein n=1 Tax=Cupriavidus neocaledonicus TaxID=1040979 RepID=A0A375H659_9BURK|nr:hypothetical protein [Cupriavidus neocaledonicus]SPD46725.1 protein of unknown function [Cupriavidus neocaledonicus]